MTKTVVPAAQMPSKDDVKRVKELFKSIDTESVKVQKIFTSVTASYYQAGEIISKWAENYQGKVSVSIAEQVFKSPMRKIGTAWKIYRQFRDNPDLIKNLSLNDAIRLVREKEPGGKRKIEYASDSGQQEFDWEEYFQINPVAKVPLENYRVNAPNDHELYLIKKGVPHPLKIVDIYAVANGSNSLKLAHEEMVKKIQAATEEFYSAYEQEETAGVNDDSSI
jgi:hypothetical protein